MTYAAVVGLSYALGYYRESQARALKAAHLETSLMEARLKTLEAELHPHFLFNTLHAISTLVHTDPEAADRMISRLSDLLRLTFDRSGAAGVALKEELEFLQKYLEIEQIRFQDRLAVKFDIDPETLDTDVPRLILQPLVENAIKHGIGPRAGQGLVQISTKKRPDGTWIEVRDNGVGLSRNARARFTNGVGLSNTRARLECLYGSQHRLDFAEGNGGLSVQMLIPAHRPAPHASDTRAAGGAGMTSAHDARTRVLVADDEPLARERLRMLLRSEPGLELVAECQNGSEAIDAIQELQPDLVFLDVQMPGATGFEVIEAVGAGRMPPVVFVTAYDQYALRAFDVRALDYLLKPFDRERFQQALSRARQRVHHDAPGDLERRLLALVQDLKQTPHKVDRFVVKSGGRVYFVRAEEIDWVESAGNYVKLHVGNETHLLRETMTAIESQLDPEMFFRIHRCHIVNIERVRELQPSFNGEYVVFLRTGARLTLSRGYREKVQQRLGGAL